MQGRPEPAVMNSLRSRPYLRCSPARRPTHAAWPAALGVDPILGAAAHAWRVEPRADDGRSSLRTSDHRQNRNRPESSPDAADPSQLPPATLCLDHTDRTRLSRMPSLGSLCSHLQHGWLGALWRSPGSSYLPPLPSWALSPFRLACPSPRALTCFPTNAGPGRKPPAQLSSPPSG